MGDETKDSELQPTDDSVIDDGGKRSESGDESTGDESSRSPRRSPEDDLRALESVLRRTGSDLRRPSLFEGALWFAVTILAVLLSGLVVAAFVTDHGYQVARWIMVFGTASATVGALAAWGLFVWRRPSLEQIAARVQRHSSEFRSDLVAALEFGYSLVEDGGQSLQEQGFSPALARVHLSRTLRKVYEENENNSLAHLVPSRDLTPPILALSGGLALMLIPLFFNPGWTLGVLSGERVGAPVVGERVVEQTIVGGLEAVFVYPSYTGRERNMRHLGTGYIESLQGTDVHLQAALMPGDWESLEMVVETGDDEEPDVIVMNMQSAHSAAASVTLRESGHYWFRGTTREGRPVEDRTRRNIEVIADSPPSVEITSHRGRVEVQPDDIIEFAFEASDDFGIDSMHRVHHFAGSEDNAERTRLQMPELSNEPTSVSAKSTLDLRPLELEPKDSIVVYFEARDVNTATGPGIGQSRPVTLYVESPEDKHLENIGRQQEIMEALLGHLADFLETPVGEREQQSDRSYGQRVLTGIGDEERIDRFRRTRVHHERREPILEAMNEVIEGLEDDPMMVARNLTLFKGLARTLEDLSQEGDEVFERLEVRAERRDLTVAHLQEVADYAAKTEGELERGILSLEELLISQKMELVEATAENIEELRDRLRDLLEQYRDTEDPELKEAIQREMQRLRQRMHELMQRMQMQMREMPREHVNLEAMENMEMDSKAQNLRDQLDSIDEMLENDDIDGALAALDEMELGLDSLSGDMDESFGQMQPQGLSELDAAVSDMMDKVTQLQETEQAIEERTQELQQDLRAERQEQLEAMLGPVTDELLEMIEAQQQILDAIDDRDLSSQDATGVDRVSRQMDALEEMVEQQDMEQALERSRSTLRALRSMRSTLSLSQRYTDEDSPRGRDLEASVQDSDELLDGGRAIEERIEEFMEQAQQDLQPGEEERFEQLADDQQEALERARELQKDIDAQGEQFPQLQEELGPAMEGASEAMEAAEQHLRERQMQPALDEERNALEQLNQLGDSMSQALQNQRQREREQAGEMPQREEDEVEIPGEDSSEMRERIREEMMEGMREGRSQEYESEIERYFRSLVE